MAIEKMGNNYGEVNDLVEVFKKTNFYDVIDENTFESEYFCREVENHLSERCEYDSEEAYLDYAMKTIIHALNFCQYGDTDDADDASKMLEDLTDRDLSERLLYN